jgi:hypothetical protein
MKTTGTNTCAGRHGFACRAFLGLSFLAILAAVAHAAPRTPTPKKIGQAEAAKIASQLTVGMGEDDATKFLTSNGLKNGPRIGTSQMWYHYFPLTNNLNLGLEFRPRAPRSDGALADGLLQGAFLQSNGVNFITITITFTNAP